MLVPLTQSLARPTIAAIQASGGGGWTPASLPSLKLWLKGDAGVEKDNGSGGVAPAANGDAVKQWQDQSGNGHNTIDVLGGNSAIWPTYATTGLNGKPALLANVTYSSLSLDAPTNLSGDTAFTVYAVAQLNVISGEQSLVEDWTSEFLFEANGSSPFVAIATPFGTFTASATITASTPFCVGLIANASALKVYFNGLLALTGAGIGTVGTDSNKLLIGGIYNGKKWNGLIAEVVVCDTDLSSTDRTSLEHYLSTKYALGF